VCTGRPFQEPRGALRRGGYQAKLSADLAAPECVGVCVGVGECVCVCERERETERETERERVCV
jgi:hypothetical protein